VVESLHLWERFGCGFYDDVRVRIVRAHSLVQSDEKDGLLGDTTGLRHRIARTSSWVKDRPTFDESGSSKVNALFFTADGKPVSGPANAEGVTLEYLLMQLYTDMLRLRLYCELNMSGMVILIKSFDKEASVFGMNQTEWMQAQLEHMGNLSFTNSSDLSSLIVQVEHIHFSLTGIALQVLAPVAPFPVVPTNCMVVVWLAHTCVWLHRVCNVFALCHSRWRTLCPSSLRTPIPTRLPKALVGKAACSIGFHSRSST
jgi:hypothetical protein